MKKQRITLGELLHQSANTFGESPFVTQAETGECLSYQGFECLSNQLAHGWQRRFPTEESSGEYVGIMLENSLDYLAFTYSLKKIDLIEVSINRAFRGAALSHMINMTKCKVLVTSAPHMDALSDVMKDLVYLECLIVRGNESDLTRAQNAFGDNKTIIDFNELIDDNNQHIRSQARDLDTASIMFTSGTTGKSKGCILSHRFAVRTAQNLIAPFRLTSDDVSYTPYPLSHIGPAYYDILPMMLTGGQAIIRDGFSLSRFWDEVGRYKATWFLCLGSVQQLLYSAEPHEKERNHHVTRCWSTPAPVPKADFDKRFGLHLIPGGGYGSTDAGWVVAPQWDHPGGRVISEFEIAIVDEYDDPVPANTEGELLIRTNEPGVMADGYFGDAERTQRSRKNLWFHTGDIARIDENGLFYFCCRKAERIRVRGEMVSGLEVEEGILTHPAVEDAAVIGVPSPFGEEDICAFITLKPRQSLQTEELKAHCQTQLAKFMVPAHFQIIETMPRTTTGKPEKGTLREWFNQLHQ